MPSNKILYYAKAGDKHYRLFSVSCGQGQTDQNNFLKWSKFYDPSSDRLFSTYLFTIHPDKIALKTQFRTGVTKIGDYKAENDQPEYQTLYNFGYGKPKHQLVELEQGAMCTGFHGLKAYEESNLRNNSKIVQFPDDSDRPYWIGGYFTTLSKNDIEHIFNDSGLDRILYEDFEFGNLVTLLKFICPEWEKLGCDKTGLEIQHWIHDKFVLRNPKIHTRTSGS